MSETTTPTADTPQQTPLSKQEIVRQIAKTIQDRRAARSLTLEKVSQVIKIRLPYLQAIEKGEWQDLPGEVYVRGFIKRYGQYLGLDTDKLMAPYLAVSPVSAVEKPASPKTPKTQEVGRTQLIWASVVVIFLISFLNIIRRETSRSQSAPATPAISSATATAPVAASAAALSHDVKTSVATAEPGVPLIPHTLEVFSPYPLWLRVTSANNTFEGFIPQSSSWTWKGEGNFTVRLGHTQQVVMMFDGQQIPLAEDQKKVLLPAE